MDPPFSKRKDQEDEVNSNRSSLEKWKTTSNIRSTAKPTPLKEDIVKGFRFNEGDNCRIVEEDPTP